MTRAELHQRIDEHLDAMKFKDEVSLPWGSICVQLNFENGKEVITIRERETVKNLKRV
jgi:hypothetical protein